MTSYDTILNRDIEAATREDDTAPQEPRRIATAADIANMEAVKADRERKWDASPSFYAGGRLGAVCGDLSDVERGESLLAFKFRAYAKEAGAIKIKGDE